MFFTVNPFPKSKLTTSTHNACYALLQSANNQSKYKININLPVKSKQPNNRLKIKIKKEQSSLL